MPQQQTREQWSAAAGFSLREALAPDRLIDRLGTGGVVHEQNMHQLVDSAHLTQAIAMRAHGEGVVPSDGIRQVAHAGLPDVIPLEDEPLDRWKMAFCGSDSEARRAAIPDLVRRETERLEVCERAPGTCGSAERSHADVPEAVHVKQQHFQVLETTQLETAAQGDQAFITDLVLVKTEEGAAGQQIYAGHVRMCEQFGQCGESRVLQVVAAQVEHFARR